VRLLTKGAPFALNSAISAFFQVYFSICNFWHNIS